MPKNLGITPRNGQSQRIVKNVCSESRTECKRDMQFIEKLVLLKEPFMDTRSTHVTVKDFNSNWFLECNNTSAFYPTSGLCPLAVYASYLKKVYCMQHQIVCQAKIRIRKFPELLPLTMWCYQIEPQFRDQTFLNISQKSLI